jgi:plasmid stabilization system protein ParE
MPRAVQRPAARRDFIIHYAYIAEHGGLHVAKQFRESVEATYAALAKMPRMGVPFKVRHGKHAGVRIWRVREFGDYLIAYRPSRGGVRIERLVHAKQDYQRMLK